MSYENLDELVREKQQEHVAEQAAKASAARADVEASERLNRLDEAAAKLFVEHGGQYEVSEKFKKRLRESKQTEAGKRRLIPVVMPLDVAKANPILVGRTGDGKYGFAVVSALTNIGYRTETETHQYKGWFGVTREKTRSHQVLYVESVSGYSIEIALGPDKDTELSSLTNVDGAHTSWGVTGRDVDKFENLLELAQSNDDGSSLLVKFPAKPYPGHSRTDQGDPGGPVA